MTPFARYIWYIAGSSYRNKIWACVLKERPKLGRENDGASERILTARQGE